MTITALAPHAPATIAAPTNYPQNHTAAPTPLSTTHSLAMAREDIHHAIAAGQDRHRALQYALSARDNAAAVLTQRGATAAELQDAGYYFADAEAVLAHHGADPDTA